MKEVSMSQRRALLASLAIALAAAGAARADSPAVDVLYFGEARPIVLRFQLESEGRPLEESWIASRDATFEFLDADDDGELSAKETRRYPWLMEQQRPRSGLFGSLFSGLIRSAARRDDATGMIRTEFESQYALARPMLHVAPSLVRGTDDRDLFDRADVDGDRRLSRQELMEMARRCLVLDINSDGLVTTMELLQYDNPFSREQQFYAQNMTAPRPRPELAEWISLADSRNHAVLALRIVEKYAPLSSKPADAERFSDLQPDQGVALAEDSPRSLAAADVDGNGVVDRGEVEKMLAAPVADLEIRLSLGKSDGEPPLVASAPDSGRRAAVVLESVGQSSAVFAVGDDRCELATPSRESPDYEENYKRQFAAADSDQNAYVDEKESRANGFLAGAFPRMDRDADGKLYEEELLRYIEQESASAASRLTLSYRTEGRSLFALLDRNADRRISEREFAAAEGLLDRHDRDGDGELGAEEIPRYHRLSLDRAQPGELVAVFNPASMQGDAAAAVAPGPRWFQQSDRNRDGEVSWSEFRGPRARFDALDISRDERIDAAEAENAGKP